MCDTPFSSRWLACFWSVWLPLLADRMGEWIPFLSPPAGQGILLLLLGIGAPLLAAFLAWDPWVLPGITLAAGCLFVVMLLLCLPAGGMAALG